MRPIPRSLWLAIDREVILRRLRKGNKFSETAHPSRDQREPSGWLRRICQKGWNARIAVCRGGADPPPLVEPLRNHMG